jgi:vitamin B12 transporter
MRTFTTSLIAALAALPVAAHAEAAGDADTIIVTATRGEAQASEVGQSVTVLDLSTITQRQTLSVADLLRTTPGITIARNGGAGSVTSVFIRGAESDQTVALIDGVKLNDPAAPGGGFNFADLLTDTIERIEIVRGAQSVLWGSQAIGGVVNLISRAPTEDLSLSARGEYGRYDQKHLTGHASAVTGPVAWSAGAGYLDTDGISVFDRRLGGAEADGYRLFGAHAKAVVTLNEAVSVDLRGFYTRSKVELDGFPPPSFSLGDTREYSRQRQLVGYAGINGALFGGRLKNRLAVAWTRIARDNYNPAPAPTTKTFDGLGRNLRYEYQGSADLADWAKATFGAEHEQQRYRTESVFSPLQRRKANTDSLYALLTVKPVTGLTASGGIRHDDHSGFGGQTTPTASIAYTPNAGTTVLRASYSEGFKAPSLYQLYGDFGNPTLQPETADSWDAGIDQRFLDGKVEARATWFHRLVTNQIDFRRTTYFNIARARAQGVELELAVKPVRGFELRANYSHIDAENRERASANFGKRLARRPRDSMSLSADYDWLEGSAGVTVTHVSDSFDNAANSVRLAGYTLVDLRAAWPITGAIELFGRIENLFDEHYRTAARYGQPGRTAVGGIRLRY